MSGFPDHVIDAAFGPDALAATHRRAEQQREQQPRWLAGLIAKHGQPVTYQPEPITLGASRWQTWAWVGFGVQVEQTLSTWTVSAHRRGRLAKLAGLKDYPTDAEISGVVALAGLDDAPDTAPAAKTCGALCRDVEQERDVLAATVAAIPDARDAANLAHARVARDRYAVIVNAARAAAERLLRQEQQHSGSGREGHLNEDDLVPLFEALGVVYLGGESDGLISVGLDDAPERAS